MNQTQLEEKLQSIINLLEKVKRIYDRGQITNTNSKRKTIANEYMSKILRLYLAGQSDSSLLNNSEYQEYIQQSSIILKRLIYELNNYIDDIEGELRGSFYYPEQWENSICWRRSAIEALKEMYKNTLLEEFYYELDTEDLDDSIEMKAHKEGGLKEDQIPKGIPTSHWWWWSPEEPPISR